MLIPGWMATLCCAIGPFGALLAIAQSGDRWSTMAGVASMIATGIGATSLWGNYVWQHVNRQVLAKEAAAAKLAEAKPPDTKDFVKDLFAEVRKRDGNNL